jgi:hypothetical protein
MTKKGRKRLQHSLPVIAGIRLKNFIIKNIQIYEKNCRTGMFVLLRASKKTFNNAKCSFDITNQRVPGACHRKLFANGTTEPEHEKCDY